MVRRYSAAPGEQRDLTIHTDGSLFSFNLLLGEPSDFDGGGTFFEPTKRTVSPPRGGAVAHSGHVRHGGAPISRGVRHLLVGFVGVAPYPYAVGDTGSASTPTCWAARAARRAFLKFGAAAWERDGPETAAAELVVAAAPVAEPVADAQSEAVGAAGGAPVISGGTVVGVT
jgi:hypothetical protein